MPYLLYKTKRDRSVCSSVVAIIRRLNFGKFKMRTPLSSVLVVFVTFGGIFFSRLSTIKTISTATALCDLCDCKPSPDEPTYVNCRFNDTQQTLFLKQTDEKTLLSRIETLNISGCNVVAYPPNGFPEFERLKTLEIKAMKSLSFTSSQGVFPNLNSLIIEDIGHLQLYEFKNQSALANIEIRRSNISTIAPNSFGTIKSLKTLSFVDTAIRSLSSRSINPDISVNGSLIECINCKINNISFEGIFARVSKLELRNTTIDAIDSNGISLNATENVQISGCQFGDGLQSRSFKLRSSAVDITGNEFVSIPNKLLDAVSVSVSGRKINFVGNLIRDIDLGGFLLDSKSSDELNFSGNKIVCDCSARKISILRRQEMFPGLIIENESYIDSVLNENLCENYDQIRLSDFKRQLLNHSICYDSLSPSDDDVSSTYPTTPIVTATKVSDDVSIGMASGKVNFLLLYFSISYFSIIIRW